jgi:hypothetical protein
MGMNFVYLMLDHWFRTTDGSGGDEPRPHIVPVTEKAKAFMDLMAQGHGKARDTVFGGFTDAISRTTEGQHAFRFIHLSDAEIGIALARAEMALIQHDTTPKPAQQYFDYEGHTYVVTIRHGKAVYRDNDHLGGPWSDASRTVVNTSIKLGFRRRLGITMQKLF